MQNFSLIICEKKKQSQQLKSQTESICLENVRGKDRHINPELSLHDQYVTALASALMTILR